MDAVMEKLKQEYITARTVYEVFNDKKDELEREVLRDFNKVDKNGNPLKSVLRVSEDDGFWAVTHEFAERDRKAGYSEEILRAYETFTELEDKIWKLMMERCTDAEREIMNKVGCEGYYSRQRYIEQKMDLAKYRWETSILRDRDMVG